MGHEAERTRTILDAHHDDATLGKVFPHVATIPLGLETTTVDPHQNGQTVVGGLGRGDNTDVEAILIHHIGRTTRTCGLWGHGAELVAHSYTLPALGWLWSFPTQVANRWLSVGDGLVNGQFSIEDTLDITCFHVGLQERLPLYGCGCHQRAKRQNNC